MVAMTPPGLVSGPERQSLPFGLFSTFTLRPASGDRWESGVLWEPETCEPADGIGQIQCLPEETEGLPKNLLGNLSADDPTASAFTVYGHFRCTPVGWTPATAQERAVSHLLMREEARVEQALWTGDLDNLPTLRGSTVVGTGTTDVVAGLGLLENFLGAEIGVQGVIHMTRASAVALFARGALISVGGRLTTALGTPVVAGAGYDGSSPAGVAAAAGTQWMYVTPALFGYRSEIFDSSNVSGDLFDRATNTLYAVAERSYLLGFDPCGKAAVLVDLD